MKETCIILDRDGVINHDSKHYIRSPQAWHPINGSLSAIAKLNAAGFRTAIATNQSGLARGYFSRETLNHMHQKMTDMLSNINGKIDAIAICPHHPNANCDCRKPKPGLLETIAKQLNITLSSAYFVGDSLKDLQAAIAVGTTPILVETGKGLETRQKLDQLPMQPAIYPTLSDFVMDFLATGAAP